MSPAHLFLCPVFLMQGAADPGHPNKYSCTPHPPTRRSINFEQTVIRRNGRAAACRDEIDMKHVGICRLFGKCRRRKTDNIQSKKKNRTMKYYSKCFQSSFSNPVCSRYCKV